MAIWNSICLRSLDQRLGKRIIGKGNDRPEDVTRCEPLFKIQGKWNGRNHRFFALQP